MLASLLLGKVASVNLAIQPEIKEFFSHSFACQYDYPVKIMNGSSTAAI
jgi:hypothetical protein